MDLKQEINNYGKKAKEAALKLAVVSTKEKNDTLLLMAKKIREKASEIKKTNAIDIEAGEKNGLTKALLDRLLLNDARIEGMAKGIEKIASLIDPVGEIIKGWTVESGIKIRKTRVPIGVIGMIYESRPNVTADAAALALKSGNTIILRGGKEAINSNKIIANILTEALIESGLPENSINLIQQIEREGVKILCEMKDYVDVIIPRGGEGLVNAVVSVAKVPVIYHDKGLCHTYVDSEADINMARDICLNAKLQRPSVCNAMETLLIHKDIAKEFLPIIVNEMKKNSVEIRGCEKTKDIVKDIVDAKEEDWSTEYIDLILSIKIVDSVDAAINHINKYGSNHSETIVTNNYLTSTIFVNAIDASAVFINASTRFNDGGMFGFGAEIGISTNKLHARGPVALEELTTYKYIVEGTGQIRK